MGRCAGWLGDRALVAEVGFAAMQPRFMRRNGEPSNDQMLRCDLFAVNRAPGSLARSKEGASTDDERQESSDLLNAPLMREPVGPIAYGAALRCRAPGLG
jgi:hypothetical protein